MLRALKLGDLLVSVPALHAIRRAHPEHRLILAAPAWLEPIAELVGGVDALLPTPGLDEPLAIEPRRVHTAINLHGKGPESRTRIEELEPQVRLGHAGPGWPGPDWVDGLHERELWARLVSWHGMPADPGDVRLEDPGESTRPGCAIVHVGAHYGCRMWPAERFAVVASALAADGADVVLTGNAAERHRALEVARLAELEPDRMLAGRVSLREFAALVAHAGLVVSADTGAAHLASAFGTPSVVIFGPAPVEEWGPPPGPHIVLTDPRLRKGDVFSDEPDPALLAVTADDVVAAARGLLARDTRSAVPLVAGD